MNGLRVADWSKEIIIFFNILTDREMTDECAERSIEICMTRIKVEEKKIL